MCGAKGNKAPFYGKRQVGPASNFCVAANMRGRIKLKKIPGIEFKLDSLHTGTDLSQSQRHAIQMGYNFKTPLGALNVSANNTKIPGYLDDKKSLSASYMFKNNWSNLNFSYENNNYLDPKTNRFSDPVFKVSGSFVF